MKRIAALVAALLLIAGSAWAWIECESRAVGEETEATILYDTFSSDLALWDSETDTNSIGVISDGRYVVTQSSAGQVSYLNKTFGSTYQKFSVEVGVKFSNIENSCTASGQQITIWDGGELSAPVRYYIRARCNTSTGAPDQLVVGHYNGTSNTYQSQSFSFSSGTEYVIKISYLMGPSSSGFVKSWINSSPIHNVTGLSNDSVYFDRTRAGLTSATVSNAIGVLIDYVKIYTD